MKKIKSTLIFTLVLSLLLSLSAFAFSFSFSSNEFPQPTSDFFVNDFADVIDADVEAELLQIGASLYTQTTAQVVVVTVDSLDGYEVGEYALELGREWGVGSEDSDNGVVLLMSVDDREITIQVGYGLEGAITDGKAGQILDNYAIPYLSQDDFSTGLAEAYKAIVSVVCTEYGVELSDYDLGDYNSDDEYVYEVSPDEIIVIIVTVVMIGGILALILSKFNGNGTHHGGGTYYGGGVYRGSSYNSGRSSFGTRGGSFGGGGGFRGGGGSFGGGGASRGF